MGQVDNGVERLLEIQRSNDHKAQNRVRQQQFNRLHTLLCAAPGHDRTETLALCQQLERMSGAERRDEIGRRFGQAVLGRAEPVLSQLDVSGI